MNGAEHMCEVLEGFGVEYIFGLFGDIQTDFAHAVRESKIKWIGVHNEKSGGFMADIYARVAKKPGVVFSTLGPGATNLTSALANATQDRSPLIAISDQVVSSEFRLASHQFVDLAKAFGPTTGITKYSAVIKHIDQVKDIMTRAYRIATTEPMGAVHVSVPADLFSKEIKKQIKRVHYDKRPSTYISLKGNFSYNKLITRITSGNGIVIVGGIVERNNAQNEFRHFVEKYELPVFNTFRGKNAFPSDHPQSLGTISRHLSDIVKDTIQGMDFILTIGYDYNEGVLPSLWEGKNNAILNIDSYDNRIKGIFEPPSLIGDIKTILEKLTREQKIKKRNTFSFVNIKKKIYRIIDEALDVDNSLLHPKRIIEVVNRLYTKNAIIVCDVGLNKYYSGLLLKATKNNQILFSNGQSAMAFTSGAMGAKIAAPKKDVIALVGDGGFLMDPQEVLTSVEHHKQVIWIIFNNGGLGLVEQAQRKNDHNPHGVHFNKVFFTHLAKAFGLEGLRVKVGQDLYPVVKRLKESGKSAIIDVPVHYTARRKSY